MLKGKAVMAQETPHRFYNNLLKRFMGNQPKQVFRCYPFKVSMVTPPLTKYTKKKRSQQDQTML